MVLTTRFQERTVIVTGGAQGIGRATTERLLAEGARVAVFDLKASGDGATDSERLLPIEVDITDPVAVSRAVAVVAERFGGVDVLASVAGGENAVDDPLDGEHWRRIVDLNLHGPVHLIRTCLPHLKERRGAIVLVGSINALVDFGSPAYSSAKAGLSILAKTLASSLGPDGVRVNVVAPGTVRTTVWDRPGDDLERMIQGIPLGRAGEPADVAAVIAFLASADAGWITGVTLPVDGGQSAGMTTLLARVRGERRSVGDPGGAGGPRLG